VPLPNCYTNQEPVLGTGASMTAPPSSQSTAKVLDFLMHWQAQTNWCWAATTAALVEFYRGSGCQFSVATAVLGTHSANVITKLPNNVQTSAGHALGTFNHLAGVSQQPASFPEICQEIDINRPICLRVIWNHGNAHVIAIAGYEITGDGDQLVLVADSDGGVTTKPFDSFPGNYRSGGFWTHTYLTQP
jgi:Papain-like cysteine protease AvrRpt2